MFHLRDALSSSEFGGRVDDVFAALGTGSVKQPDNKTQKISRLPTKFEDQQLARLKSLKPTKNDGEQKDKWEGKSNTWVSANTTTSTGNNQGGGGQEDLRNKISKTKKNGEGEFKHPAEFLRPERRDNRFQPSRGGRGRGRFVPDHKKNPDKWTKYSLADVDLVTDRGNTAAALDFLKDLRAKKEGDEPMDEGTADPNSKVVFKKPSRKPASAPSTAATTNDEQESTTEATEKPTFVGSKQVMPEYMVGAATARKPKKTGGKPPTAKPGKELKLSHLADDEEEEDE